MVLRRNETVGVLSRVLPSQPGPHLILVTFDENRAQVHDPHGAEQHHRDDQVEIKRGECQWQCNQVAEQPSTNTAGSSDQLPDERSPLVSGYL